MDLESIKKTLAEREAELKKLDAADTKLSEAQANLNRQKMAQFALRQRLTASIRTLKEVLGEVQEGLPDGVEAAPSN